MMPYIDFHRLMPGYIITSVFGMKYEHKEQNHKCQSCSISCAGESRKCFNTKGSIYRFSPIIL